ncbi:T9SS type A sorting domain-containing protein [Fibrella sp. WM1]|uniref:T9SS type A sorting domain-containing protein n=1 Tax=Fibrella musci TaxID=3242485 RepID=UPI0035203B86
MKLLLFCALLVAMTNGVFGQSVLFQQDFNAGGTPANYVSSTPNTHQFNGINGPNGAVSIVNGALQFDRLVSGTTGHFSRTTDFSPAPTSLYIQFDFEVVSTTTVAGNSALLFYLGTAFSNGVGNPSNAETYARFGISFTGAGQAFAVRNIPSGGGGGNSATFTGKQQITFVLNNTGFPITYLQPGGGSKQLLNDQYDLWVGGNRVFSDQPVLTPTQTMTDFKLRIDDDVYAAVFQFDNFLIRDISGSLPLSLTQFWGEAQHDKIQLIWQTASAANGSLFAVERRTESGEFAELGTLPATDVPSQQRTYSFTDAHPRPGLNYYRLRQIGPDNTVTWSRPIEVRYEPNQPMLTLLGNPTSSERIQVRTQGLDDPMYRLTNLAGQRIDCQQQQTPDGEVTLLPQHPLPSGVYLLTASSATHYLTRRLVIR